MVARVPVVISLEPSLLRLQVGDMFGARVCKSVGVCLRAVGKTGLGGREEGGKEGGRR